MNIEFADIFRIAVLTILKWCPIIIAFVAIYYGFLFVLEITYDLTNKAQLWLQRTLHRKEQLTPNKNVIISTVVGLLLMTPVVMAMYFATN